MTRLLRLSLFQISAGMALALLNGTLNRVMIVELHVPAALVAAMIALPVLVAPFRALIGFRSDTHRSVLGWRRVPYIWFGTLVQFGGLAIMPFALIILSGDTHAVGPWLGRTAAALAFLLVGAGLHTSQTAGLALATDLAAPDKRPRVVALLYVMLLVGLTGSALLFGAWLEDFSQIRLVQAVQGAAALTMIFNVVALWKQEQRQPAAVHSAARPAFRDAWRGVAAESRFPRFLVTVVLGTLAFSMQDILLEPFGADVLGLSVASTARLTAWMACGALLAYGVAARSSARGGDPHRLAASGLLCGVAGFSAVLFAATLVSASLFIAGVLLIGFGAGLFAVATLLTAMARDDQRHAGLALGAWGAAQTCAAGVGIAAGGTLRDVVSSLAAHGALGPALLDGRVGYNAVYQIEILLLFATLVALGPLVRNQSASLSKERRRPFGLADLPS